MRLGIDKLSRKDAFIIGVAQALALVPGVSRSGITIVTGLMLRLERQTSARFSFFQNHSTHSNHLPVTVFLLHLLS